jgi:TPR repeat protein
MIDDGRWWRTVGPGRWTRPALRRVVIAALVLVGSLVAAAPVLRAETRLALVIGNSAYATNALQNPKNDAESIARALKIVGFEVVKLTDADQTAMKRAIVEFGRKLRASDAVGLFYYAGHGVQVAGENYLIPVGADIKDVEEAALSGVSLGELLRTMERSSGRLNIAILDACRDNPFPASTRSGTRGLAQVKAPTGTLIAYATAPGEVALDGTGGNSPYSAALAEAIPTIGISIDEVFRRTRRKVLDMTAHKQTPWEHSSLTGEFFFRPKSAEAEASVRPVEGSYGLSHARLSELRDWERIKDTTDAAVLSAHVERYPDGVFREVVSLRLSRLQNPPSPWNWIFSSDSRSARLAEAETIYEQAVRLDNKATGAAALAEAAGLFLRAAELGLPSAMYQAARGYDHGRGVARNIVEAAKWYRLAAEQEHPGAMASLGTMYEFGEGVERDLAVALRYYRLAAEAGDAHAMTSLGFLYATGKGVARDLPQARRWYANAADRGHPRAMYNLALLAMRGEGGVRDMKEAVRLLKAAAERKHAAAMRELAFLYDEGRGVERSAVQAATHLLASYKAGNKDARLDVRIKSLAWSFATRREIQRQLIAQGIYAGPVHGVFDTTTRKALERYASGD